jgi:CheY-like chemotaxis protein
LFVDGIEGFRAASVYADRMPRFHSAFCNQLRMYDVTGIITEELALFRPEIEMPNPELANVVETVILLRYVELRSQLHRLFHPRVPDSGRRLGRRIVLRKRGSHPQRIGADFRRRFPERGGVESMKTILIVDDEFDLTSTLRAVLERRGYNTEVCSNGREALECLVDARPDLILLDVMMPLGNGYFVIEQLRKIPALAQTPVVLMNSVPPPNGLPILWQAFLRKPLSIATLLDTIEQFIGPPLAEPVKRN